ncbi:MAG: choice-of-anchor B domain-containing protein [Chlamydiales bacterium]|jgi:choice-of-anchor B domain-containing protein
MQIPGGGIPTDLPVAQGRYVKNSASPGKRLCHHGYPRPGCYKIVLEIGPLTIINNMRSTLLSALLVGFTASVVSSSVAMAFHEDDPKMLDRVPAYAGKGWRPGAPAGGSSSFISGTDSVPPVDFQSEGVQLLSWVTLGEFGAASGNDCWGYTSPSGREYALLGMSTGTGVVEISDPTFPQILTTIDGPTSLWRDIKTYDHYAYAVSEGGSGIQVIDLDQVDQGVVSLVREVTNGGTSATHNVAIDEVSGYLYRCGGGSYGLRIYTLADPSNPVFVRSWSDIYVHDVQVVTYTSGPYAGRQVAFACGGFGNGGSATRLEILDVTDKNNIFMLSRVIWPDRAYSHQVWLSPDRQYAYINDELDEGPARTTTYVADISDIDSAFLATSFTNGKRAIGHNLYTKGDLIYEANYRSGLRVFDASDPLNAVEVRHFDTWPGYDAVGFNGLWSVYPFFPSGVVIGSDLEKGLFVLWADDPIVAIAYPAGVPLTLDPTGDSVTVQLTERSAGEMEMGSAELHVDAGAGFVTSSLVDLGGGLFRADFPAMDCAQEVHWYVSARSTDGITWNSPDGAPRYSNLSFTGTAAVTLMDDDAETDNGWMLGAPGDTATNGVWERGVPPGRHGAPSEDHSEAGDQCWHTATDGDVDFGYTSLVSPLLDLSGTHNPRIDYWRWYSSSLGSITNHERMRIGITNDDGATWVNLETLGLVNDLENLIGWFHHGVFVRDYVEPTSQVRVRFRARDLNQENQIEAAVDDFRVLDVVCDCAAPSNVCSFAANSAGPGAIMGSSGSTSVTTADLALTVTGAIPNGSGLFYYGPNTIQTAFGDGFRCVGGNTKRLFPSVSLDGAGAATYNLDFVSPPVGAGPNMVTSGSSWTFQFWYRDVAAGASGFNLSDGLRVSFCP